jgi:hypothetical protein
MGRQIHRVAVTALLHDRDVRDRQLWARFTREVADLARHPAYNDLFLTVNGATDDTEDAA